jgi:hypothetical protein
MLVGIACILMHTRLSEIEKKVDDLNKKQSSTKIKYVNKLTREMVLLQYFLLVSR